MIARIRYLTHPQVRIDPNVPVPMWELSEEGRARARALSKAPWIKTTSRIVSSAERKAIETAEIVGATMQLDVEVRAGMNENDRSATGFLDPAEFEAVAEGFFACPTVSVRGWERAIDAQHRIVSEVEQLLTPNPDGDMLIVGHGGVGTLLLCHHSGLPIARTHDQPAGGGNYFSFTRTGLVLHAWRPLEMPPDR